MSLKTFHIVFILASIALSALFGFWAFGEQATGLIRTLGVLSFLIGAGLVAYLVGFLRKMWGVTS